jgi:hypothetical protein
MSKPLELNSPYCCQHVCISVPAKTHARSGQGIKRVGAYLTS